MKLPTIKPPTKKDILTDRVQIKMAEAVLKFFLYNFSNEGYNKESFIGWKNKKRDTGTPILFDTGLLKSSFGITYNPNGFVIYNSAPYAKILNDGDIKRNLPARPIIYASEEVNKIINDIFLEEVEAYFKNPKNYII